MVVRGISTVVDTTIFLLVLGVAVATIAGVPMLTDGDGVDRADAIAERLATGTERVNYSLAAAARSLPGEPPITVTDGPPFERSAHGTLASLLADATVATVTIDGASVSRDGGAYERAVVDTTRPRIRAVNRSVQVSAVWEPYPSAPVTGRVVVGSAPPPAVDVRAATVTVDVPVPASRDRAITAARQNGYDGVGRVVADAVVRGIFPPGRAELALRGDYPVSALVAQRYADAREALGAKPTVPTTGSDVRAINEDVSNLLAANLADDLRTRYKTPVAAARDVSSGTATITVRTWSP